MKKHWIQSKIEEHVRLNDDMWKLSFISQEISSDAVPGQFVHMCIPDRQEPFLRRPFSISSVDRATNKVNLIYKVVGKGTKIFSKLEAGDKIDCMGPMGFGYNITGEKNIIVGGGMGIAPLVFLADELKTKPINTHVLIGARNKAEMFWAEYFSADNLKVDISTDDGSMGRKGFVTEALLEVLEKESCDQIYACGPEPLLKAVAKIAQSRNIPCQVSLEKHMACAVGACLSCAFETTSGIRKKVCTDGPVFDSLEVF